MKTLNEVMSYLECPRKYSFLGTNSVVKDLSDNDKLKRDVKEGVQKIIEKDISLEDFFKETFIAKLSEVSSASALYNLVKDNKDKFTDDKIIKIALRKVDLEQSLYYNMYQVLECNNAPLRFNVIILNKIPKLEEITLNSRTKAQVEEVKNQFASVNRMITIVEKDSLPFIKRPNAITCKGCIFNKECKPICFERE